MTFEQKLEENEEASHAGFWGEFWEKGTVPERPEEGACLANSRNRKEASGQARWIVVRGEVTAVTGSVACRELRNSGLLLVKWEPSEAFKQRSDLI